MCPAGLETRDTADWEVCATLDSPAVWDNLRSMDAIAIRQVLGARPFQPVVLHLADGRSLEVPHSDFAFISQSGRRVIVEKSDDSFEIVEALLINSVEVKSSAQPA